MPTSSSRFFLSVPVAILLAFMTFTCVAGKAHADGMTTETRQQYMESGKYIEDITLVSEQARSWIMKSTDKLAPRLKACKKAHFKVGITDPGPDPTADYSAPTTVPAGQMPKYPIYAGPSPGPATASSAAKPKKKPKKKKHLPKVTKKICGNTKKIAIAMDMDETATSSFRIGSTTPEYDYPGASARNIIGGTQTAINPMLQTYKLARKRGVAVFVITARPAIPTLVTITEKNLADVGYTDLAGIYVKPLTGGDTGEVKNTERAEIVKRRGYNLIAMFGDQDSDLVDGFFQRGFKFPDVY